MNKASRAVEDYLKCIFVYERRNPGQSVPNHAIADALDVTYGSVTAMLKNLAGGRLVEYEPYHGVRLTGEGQQLAARVLRRHRLIELLLVEVVGLSWSEVHEEAELLEHAVSDRLVERVAEVLGHPELDPHGDPIPTRDGTIPEYDQIDLLNCPLELPRRVSRISDQSREFLEAIDGWGLRPGRVLEVTERDELGGTVSLRLPEHELSLGSNAARKILTQSAAVGDGS